MLLLFETAAGFALFKVNKEDKLEQTNVRVVSTAQALAALSMKSCCCCLLLLILNWFYAAGLCKGL